MQAQNTPLPRVEEGQKLSANGVKCAMDISDGLVADLEHICRASRVGSCNRYKRRACSPCRKNRLRR